MATNKNAAEAVEEVKTPEAVENTAAPETVKEPEMEDIYIPRGYANDEPNLHVGFNGVNYLLPKGKTSRVPKAVANEIRRSQRAQEKLDQHVDELLEASK